MNYSGKKRFKITNDFSGWEMEVIIDFDFPKVMEHIKEMVEFWTDWEERLALNKGDYVRTFLQQLGQKVYMMTFQDYIDLVKAFEYQEGYCRMDGSCGITIIKFDDPEIPEKEDFEIEEVC